MTKTVTRNEADAMRSLYGRMASVLSDYSLATLTLYVKQDGRAVDVALTIATGMMPRVRFVGVGKYCWFLISFPSQPSAQPMIISPSMRPRTAPCSRPSSARGALCSPWRE